MTQLASSAMVARGSKFVADGRVQPTMSAAEADAAAELQAAEGAAAAAALMAEVGGEVEAMAEPLNAQQLEAKFYADLAAELRDADF